MKKYAPILILTTIIAISAPFMRTVQGQPQVQHGRSQSAAAVVFSATEHYVDGLPKGYFIYEMQCSPNCPKSTSEELAATLEFYLARGFVIHSSDGFVFRMIRVPTGDKLID